MKKLALALVMVVFVFFPVLAQPGGSPAERLQREIDGLKTELGLSADQLTKITPIVTAGQAKQREEFTKMRESGSFDREKFMEIRKKFQDEIDAQLKTVLTPEQVTKLEAYRKKQLEEMQKRMQGN
jgi:Spy/CpxP family protein refolding chaperone